MKIPLEIVASRYRCNSAIDDVGSRTILGLSPDSGQHLDHANIFVFPLYYIYNLVLHLPEWKIYYRIKRWFSQILLCPHQANLPLKLINHLLKMALYEVQLSIPWRTSGFIIISQKKVVIDFLLSSVRDWPPDIMIAFHGSGRSSKTFCKSGCITR